MKNALDIFYCKHRPYRVNMKRLDVDWLSDFVKIHEHIEHNVGVKVATHSNYYEDELHIIGTIESFNFDEGHAIAKLNKEIGDGKYIKLYGYTALPSHKDSTKIIYTCVWYVVEEEWVWI